MPLIYRADYDAVTANVLPPLPVQLQWPTFKPLLLTNADRAMSELTCHDWKQKVRALAIQKDNVGAARSRISDVDVAR